VECPYCEELKERVCSLSKDRKLCMKLVSDLEKGRISLEEFKRLVWKCFDEEGIRKVKKLLGDIELELSDF